MAYKISKGLAYISTLYTITSLSFKNLKIPYFKHFPFLHYLKFLSPEKIYA